MANEFIIKHGLIVNGPVTGSEFTGSFFGDGTGLSGVTGPTGPTGPQGTTGIQGITGTQGTTGIQGTNGTQGTTGTTGSQGTTGTTGSQGTTGTTGSQGTTGTTGSQGTTGTTGSQGTTGTTGSQGTTGTTGAQGTNAATAISNNTDNYVVTATGNGTTPFNGENRLLFDGTTLALTGDLTVSSDAHVQETFLAGEDALPNSDFILANGSTSAIDSGMAVSSSMGQVIDSQAPGETINAGQLVYKASNGRLGLADADATSTSTNLLGIALNTVTAGNVIDVFLDGVVTIHSPYITAGDIGNPLYVDTTAGSITNTAPSGENDVVRIVGHFIRSGTGYTVITFKPDGTWIEL